MPCLKLTAPFPTSHWPHPFPKPNCFSIPNAYRYTCNTIFTMEDDISTSEALSSGTLPYQCDLPASYEGILALKGVPSLSQLGLLGLLGRGLGCPPWVLPHQPTNDCLLNCLVYSALHCAVMRGLRIDHAPSFPPTSSITLSIQLKRETAGSKNVPQRAAKTQTPHPPVTYDDGQPVEILPIP